MILALKVFCKDRLVFFVQVMAGSATVYHSLYATVAYLFSLLAYLDREIFINQQEITTLTVISARQLVSPQPKLGPVP